MRALCELVDRVANRKQRPPGASEGVGGPPDADPAAPGGDQAHWANEDAA